MRKLIKKLVSITAYYLHLWPLVFRLCRLKDKKPVLAVFMFHRINPGEPDQKYLQGYERGISKETYDRQVNQISRLYRLIDLAEFTRIITGEQVPMGGKPMALLTFDDADKDHPSLAFAKLSRHGFPGVSFVPTGFIGTSKRFYHLRLTNICNRFDNETWQEIARTNIPESVKIVIEEFSPEITARIRAFRRRLIAPFEDIRPSERDALLHDWEARIGFAYDLDICCMDWDGVRNLPKQGVAVGSHTVNHNRLAMLGAEEKTKELAESKAVLEREIGATVETICYPEGSFDKETLELSAGAGYRLGFTTEDDLVDYPRQGLDLFRIPRVGAGVGAGHEIAFSIGAAAFRRLVGPKKGARG